MDELKIKLKSVFMRGIVKKFLISTIKKKFGIKPDIELNGLEIERVNNRIRIHVDTDIELSDMDVLKLTSLFNEET